MSIKMLHTCIRVKDLEKSLKFYEEALELKEVKRMDFEEDKFSLVFVAPEDGSYEIELTYNYDREEPYEMGNGFSHLAIGVDDLEHFRDKHIELGYEVTDLKGLPARAPNFYFVTDPDGYKIEVIRNR